VLGIQVNGG